MKSACTRVGEAGGVLTRGTFIGFFIGFMTAGSTPCHGSHNAMTFGEVACDRTLVSVLIQTPLNHRA